MTTVRAAYRHARVRVGVVCVSLWLLTGCAVEPFLMPTPAVFKDERRSFTDWYANDWISTDVTLSLRDPIPPARRCLVNVPHSPRVWRMPDNYPQCVADRLLAAFPELRRSQ